MAEKKDKSLGEFGYTRRIIVTVLVLLLFVFIYFIRHVFIYLTFAALLAYIIALPVDVLVKRFRFPHTAATLLSLFGMLLLIAGFGFLVVPPIAEEFNLLIRGLPEVLASLENYINTQIQVYGRGTSAFTIQSWLDQIFTKLQENLPAVAGTAFTTGVGVVNAVSNAAVGAIFVPIMSYYFVKDSDKFRRSFELIIPARTRPIISSAIEKISTSLGGYVRGQILLCLIVGVTSTLGLLILDVKYAFVLGLVAGVMEVIPMVGPILGLIPAAIIAFTTSPLLALKVIILYLIIQGAENFFLAPRIRGTTMNMHPITVIISMMIGARVMGGVGMFLALPVAAVIKTVYYIYLESRILENGNTLNGVESEVKSESA